MARPYRLQGEGLLYHIFSRGDNRKKIFISERDYSKFLEYVKLAQDKYNFYLYAYSLMENHYHLLLETSKPNLSKIMQYINTSYTVYYNKKRNKCGHVFQGRYKSILVEADSYFKELTRYIHLNPVKAKLAVVAEEYRWSSCSLYINNKSSGLVDIERVKRLLDMDIKQYSFFVNRSGEKEKDFFRNVYAGFILGRKDFIKEQLSDLNFLKAEKDFAHKKTICCIEPERIIEAVVKVYHIESQVLFMAVKKSLLAKKVAVYLLKRYSSLTNQEIGKMFSVSYSAVSKINKDVQELMIKERHVKEGVEKAISHFKV